MSESVLSDGSSQDGSGNTATEFRFRTEDAFVTWLVSNPENDDSKSDDNDESALPRIRIFEQSNGAFALYGSDSDLLKEYLKNHESLSYDTKQLRSTDQFIVGIYVSQRVLNDWLVNNDDTLDRYDINLYRCMNGDDQSHYYFYYRLITDESEKLQTLYQSNREECIMHAVIVKSKDDSNNKVFVSAATRISDKITWISRFCDTNLLSDLSAIVLSQSVDTCYAYFIDERYSSHEYILGKKSSHFQHISDNQEIDEETVLSEISKLSKMIRNAKNAISKVCRKFVIENELYQHHTSDDVYYLNASRMIFDKDCLASDIYRGILLNNSDDQDKATSVDCEMGEDMKDTEDASGGSAQRRASGKRRRLSDMKATDQDPTTIKTDPSSLPSSAISDDGFSASITTAKSLLSFYRLDIGHHDITDDDWYALHLCCTFVSKEDSDTTKTAHKNKVDSMDRWRGYPSDIRTLDFLEPSNYLRLDKSSQIALNVFPNATDQMKESSLYGLLNQCRTQGGQNLLRQWLNQPLTNEVIIHQRQALICIFKHECNYDGRRSLYERWLKSVPKFSRMQKQWQNTRDKLTPLVTKEQELMELENEEDDESQHENDGELSHSHSHSTNCLTNIQQTMMEASITNLSVLYSFLIGGFNGIISALKEISIEGDDQSKPHGLCRDENEMMNIRRKLEDEFVGSLERWKRKCARYERMCETFLDLGLKRDSSGDGRSSKSRNITSISPDFDEHLKYLNDKMIQTHLEINDYYYKVCKKHGLKKATLKQVKCSDISMLGKNNNSNSMVLSSSSSGKRGGGSDSSAQSPSSFVIRLPKGEATRKILNALQDKSKLRLVKESKNDKLVSSLTLQDLSEEYFNYKRDYLNWTARLVWQMIGTVQTFYPLFTSLSNILSEIDVLVSLAEVSILYNWERPSQVLSMSEGDRIILSNARHPCLDAILRNETNNSSSFSGGPTPGMDDTLHRACVPNDISMIKNQSNFQLITGPNMGGKSTILRSVALIILLNQCGCLLPVDGEESVITIVDSILSRIGASDNEMDGISTFLSEMIDIRNIQDCVSEFSLVIVDELGRGTSTNDGYAIAETFSEHLIEEINCFTLFATHFHELSNLSGKYPSKVVNKQVCINPHNFTMTFKLADGYCQSSFGIEAAKRVGFPERMILIAKKRALELEIMYSCRTNPEIHEFLNHLADELKQGKITSDQKNKAIKDRAETDPVLAKICAKSKEISALPAIGE